jgi:Secretion system C-terminal sorting domain/PKD-like domain
MKKILTLAILVIAGLTSKAQIEKVTYRGAFAPAPAAPWTDTWTEWDPQNHVYPSTSAAPTGGSLVKIPASGANAVISTNTTWTKNNTYIIAGLVYVKAGVTLTIEAGTTIFGSNAYPNSALVVTKGAKLIAIGTPDQPIVFTSMYPVGQRHPGDWGGVILLGKAPYNGVSSATSPIPNTFGINYIEGITEVNNSATTGESTEFGGGTSPVANDNSGTLKYVRIEFGGYIFAQNKEINGLTMGAVGNGTTIDYVQCSYINDDAFEWFGGNVNCSHLISYRGVDDEWDTDNGFSGAVQYCLGVRDPQVGDNSYSLASGGSTSEGYESDNDANGSDNNPRTKALFTNITNIGPLRGDNSAAMQASIHPAFRRSARIRRNSELKIFNSILSDYPTGLMVDNALGNTAQAFVDGRAKFKNNILSGNKVGGLTETAGTLPTGFSARSFVLANFNDSTSRADSFLVAPYGVDTTHTLAAWSINAFKTADYRPKEDTTGYLAGHGADFTDTSFNNFSLVTCPTVAKPSVISGTSFSVSSTIDTLKTFTVDAIAGADAYVWGITGASSGNKIKSGFGSRTVTFIVKSVPATVFVSATNYCNQSDTSAATISCDLNPTAPTAMTGTKNINNCTSTLQTYKITKVAGNTYSWTVTGTGNQLVSSASDSAVFAMVAAGNITVTAKTACNQTGVTFTQAILKTAVANPASLTGVAVASNICGARVWRFTAPALPTGANGYLWSLAGVTLGASVDSGSLTGSDNRYIKIKFTSNAAAATLDSIKVAFTYECGVTGTKGLKLALTALNAPAAPTAITITSLGATNCGQPRYRYAAPTTGLPAATTTTGAATAWEWSFTGVLGATFVADSASTSARVVTGYFTSTAAATVAVGSGDSVKCRYASGCGFGAYKASKLTNTLTSSNPPATPTSVTATLVSDVCGARVYRYAAPVLPAGTATNAAPTGYDWTLPTGSAVATSGTLDSGVLSGRYIRVIYTSNAGAVTGDSIRVRYTSACGVGANKALKLTNVAKVCLVGAPVYSKTTNTIDGIKAQVYPNPNAGNFTVRIETGVTAKANASIQIIDMNGRMVENFTAVNNNGLISQNINNSNLTNGVYTVRYTVGTTTSAIKMVVQK